MPPAGFEPTISAGERPQTYTLDGAATGTGWSPYLGDCKVQTLGGGCYYSRLTAICPDPLTHNFTRGGRKVTVDRETDT